MQLIKDDINATTEDDNYIPLFKFQQVVNFIDRYYDNPILFLHEHPDMKFWEYLNEREIIEGYEFNGNALTKISDVAKYNKALLEYCFKDGLK